MAIKMVRQPSDTPNINNIDDIVGLRYAYGNQDGYVIGKGNELGYSVDGSNFKVLSGRVVLQGVESDVDANGVTLTVDNVSELRYYTVYYQVNMATNTTSILLSNYDTATYPVIEKGSDLTADTIGIANLELYHFQAVGGVIREVKKLVKQIDYNTKLYNHLFLIGTTIDNKRVDAFFNIICSEPEFISSNKNSYSDRTVGTLADNLIQKGYDLSDFIPASGILDPDGDPKAIFAVSTDSYNPTIFLQHGQNRGTEVPRDTRIGERVVDIF